MKKITLLFAMMTLAFVPINAQTEINFDPASTEGSGWIGFMNWFETPANGGGYSGGGGWGVADLVVTDNMDGTVSLLPNRIGDAAEFWQGPGPAGNATGNKIMEATYYIQDDDLVGTDFTFSAEVIANTLDATGILDYPFVVTAFIKVFASDFSSNVTVDSYNLAVGNFTLSHANTDSITGEHVQYGFIVSGPNVRLNTDVSPNPGFYDDDYAALGGILVGPHMTLSTTNFEASSFKAFPNPTQNSWTIKSNQVLNEIQIFDMLGKNVMSVIPESREVNIDANQLSNGIYFAQIKSTSGINSIKLVKE